MQRIHKIWLGVAFVTCASTGIAVADDPPPSQDEQQQPSQPSQPSGGMQGQDTEGAQGAQGAQGTQQQGMQGTVMAEKQSATATVEKLDKKKRKITLKNEQGNTVTVKVPENVSRLDAVKKGDKVQIDYYESVALSLVKPEKGKAGGARETTMKERTPGQLPGGLMARKMTETVQVMKVDKDNNQVTIKSPTGDTSTIKVDPSMSSELENIKQGDRIKASYTEAIALSVTPEEKPKMQEHQGRESGQQQRSKGSMDEKQQQEQQQPHGY